MLASLHIFTKYTYMYLPRYQLDNTQVIGNTLMYMYMNMSMCMYQWVTKIIDIIHETGLEMWELARAIRIVNYAEGIVSANFLPTWTSMH